MNSAGNTEGMNETVRERGILSNLNVTLATQESLFGNRSIEPRAAGLDTRWERKRLSGLTV